MGMGVIATLYHARFRPGRGARGGDEVPREEHRGDDGERAAPAPPEHQAADPEEREVDDRTAEEPLHEPGADRDPPGGVGGDGAPAVPMLSGPTPEIAIMTSVARRPAAA